MIAAVVNCVGAILVFEVFFSCYGQSTWPKERGLIMTTFRRYVNAVQLRHLPVYPGYETFEGDVPGVNFSNPNLHFKSVDVDYRTRCIYLYDSYQSSILMGTGYNKDLRIKNMTFYPMHVGVSKGTVQVAIDWLSHTVYWSDAAFRWIIAAPGQKDKIDKDYYKIIADKHLEAPDGITVDPSEGYLFWSDNGMYPKIERSDLKGGQRHTIVSKYLKSPLTLEADVSEKRIYWIDSFSETILSATYDGEDITAIQRIPDSSLLDLAVFRDLLYISDPRNGNVYTLNKTRGVNLGKQEDETIDMFPDTIYGLAVYGTENQPMKDKDFCAEKKCEHLCITTMNGAECICSEGFMLDEDTGKCQDTGEGFQKAIVIANATHICLLDIRAFAQTSFEYVCKFSVFKQNITRGSTLAKPSTTEQTVTRASSSTAGIKYTTPVPKDKSTTRLGNITKLDMDMENRLLFFATDDNTIYKRPIDLPIENDAVELIVTATGNISGLAYDAGDSNNLYWCESDTGNIRVVNVVTKASKNITSDNNGFTKPRDIAVILKHRLLAVIAGESRYYRMFIQTVTMDGKDRKSITRGKYDISAFTVDNENDVLYYTSRRYLYYTTYNGSVEGYVLYSGDTNAYPLIQYHKYITWVYSLRDGGVAVKSSDLQTKTVVSNGMFGNTSVAIVGMKVLDITLQSTNITSPCVYENGGCSHICITKYVNDVMNLACECRFGYVLAEDGTTCNARAVVEDNFIIATDRTNNELLQIDLETNEVSAITDSENNNYEGVYYDAKTKNVIWAENYSGKIYRANLNGTVKQLVSNLGYKGYPYRFDKDMTTRNLYFTTAPSYYNSFIGMITPTGENYVLKRMQYWTTLGDIVVHPGKGWMYFTASGYHSQYVGRAYMDGENSEELISGNHVDDPNGLAIDFINEHLYWSDATFDTIQRCNLDGVDCITIVNMTGTKEGIRDIVTDAEFLYYSAYKNHHIVRVSLEEPFNTTKVGQNPGVGKLDTITFYSSKNKNIQPESGGCRGRDGLGDCSTICYPSPHGRSCGCRKRISLKADGRTCSNIYQCTDLIEQTVSFSQVKQKVIDITFPRSCLRYLDDKCHYKCPNDLKPIFNTLLTCTNVGWNLESKTLCQEIRCPERIDNGMLDSSCDREVGSSCNFLCNTGFIKAAKTALCLGNGTYQMHESELCAPHMCPIHIEKGKLDENCTRELGVSCNFSCNEYFTTSIKNLQITCLFDGWSPETSSLCKESICTDGSLEHGTVTGNCQKKIGNVCTFQCDKGYTNTTDEAVCKSDLMWHPEDSCTPVNCPPVLPNGTISGSCNFAVGTTCSFKCNDGFRANSLHTHVTCKINGQWNVNPCFEILCPTSINNGNLSTECNREVGENCAFECNDGFTPTTTSAFCTKNGTYLVQGNELCRPFKCNDRIENGALADGCARSIGSSCRYTCNVYFTPSVSNMEATCLANGWNPTDLCIESVCEDASLLNGKVNGACEKKIGETCMIQCNQGYVNTTRDVVCQDDHVWYPRDMCTVFKCSDTIENGILAADCSRTIGTSCKFSCNQYFSPKVINTDVTCQADGWSPSSSDLCEESMCPESSFQNGKIVGICSQKVGDACMLQCDTGYINATDVIFCKTDYTWHPKEPCTAVKCLSSIPNGEIVADCDHTIGATCGFKCHEDFTPNKLYQNITCKRNGQWDVAGELCSAVRCPSSIPNGEIVADCDHTIGATCGFRCHEDFTTNKLYPNITCKGNGQWDVADELCLAVKCPSSIPNGEIAADCDHTIGATCGFRCHEDFTTNKLYPNITCKGNGQWDFAGELCSVFRCSDTIENGIIAADCSRIIGTSCRLSCNKYFSPKLINTEVTCQADGWSPRSSDICEESMCPDSPIHNGKVAENCSKKVGDACMLQCDTGYINTTDVIFCKADYTWHPKEPCTALKCPSSIPNGEIAADCDQTIGATCAFKCQEDFTTNKLYPNITCKGNGQWDVADELCSVFKCSDAIENGILAADCSRIIGTSCKFSCNKYFSPKVNMDVICQSNGWNPSSSELCEESVCPDSSFHNGKTVGNCGKSVGDTCMLQCDTGYINTTDVIFCKPDYTWHPVEPCTALKCPSLIPNGEISEACDYTMGATCGFKCHKDFTTNKRYPNIKCKSNGQWDVAGDLCLESTCKDGTLHNGKVTGNCQKKVGDACNFHCSKGFTNRTDVAVCKNDYVWHPKDACSEIKCQPFIPNGELTGTCDFTIGTSCNFACNDGFTAADLHADVTCIGTGQWEASDKLCLAMTMVSERLRDNGLSVPGVAVGITILALVIIALMVAMILLIRTKSSRSIKSSVLGGRSTSFENPGFLRNSDTTAYNSEEQPSTSDLSSQMQTVFSEEAVPVADRTMDQICTIEPLPDVAQLEITDDKVVLTQESWQKERHQTHFD